MANKKTLTGSDYLAKTLKENDVTHLFYQEFGLLYTINELEANFGVKAIVGHSELAVGYMADGYARASLKPGVCYAQSIGSANLAASIHDAWLGNSPVIAMTGAKQELYSRDSYQESNHFAHFSGVTKYNMPQLEPKEFPHILRQSFREVTTGSPRPAHIDLPGYSGEVIELAEIEEDFVAEKRYSKYPAYRPAANEDDVRAAAEMINKAKKPIIVSGRGVYISDDENVLTKLAEKTSIPVATTPDGKTTINEDHKLWAGIVGEYGMVCANELMKDTDLVIYIGSMVSGQTTLEFTCPPVGTKTIQIDIDASRIGKNYPGALGLQGDAKTVMKQLMKELKKDDRKSWCTKVEKAVAKTAAEQVKIEKKEFDACNVAVLCKEISDILPDNAVVVADTGWSAVWAIGSIRMKSSQKFLRAAGTLGWSVPASIGAKCGTPDRPVICFAGDGAFYYHMQEIQTAVKHGINTITVVNNNSSFAQCSDYLPRLYDPKTCQDKIDCARRLYDLGPVNFANVAEEYGALGIRVEKNEDMPKALEQALNANRPVVIDVVSDFYSIPLEPE